MRPIERSSRRSASGDGARGFRYSMYARILPAVARSGSARTLRPTCRQRTDVVVDDRSGPQQAAAASRLRSAARACGVSGVQQAAAAVRIAPRSALSP